MDTRIESLRERLRRTALTAARSAEMADVDREARDDAIEAADIDGLSVRQIREATGHLLSVTRIQRVIVDRTAKRQARLAREIGL